VRICSPAWVRAQLRSSQLRLPSNNVSHKYPLPACLNGKCSQENYSHWLGRKARSLVRRDKSRGNELCTNAAYREAIHGAVVRSGGCDFYTGEELRWDLIRSYDNEASAAGRRAYKRQFALLPTVDHLDEGLAEPKFEICGWRTNDCKGDLTVEELEEFSRSFLRHRGLTSI